MLYVTNNAKKESKAQAMSTIERALGMIEGIAYGAGDAAQGLLEAVGMIDGALEVVLEDG